MITVSIKGLDTVMANLERQVQFAAAVALTKTATAVKNAMPAVLEQKLDRPTPFTKKGFFVTKATPGNLLAVVGVMDKQAAYMRYQIEGGDRAPGSGGLRLPSAIGRNEFGNIPKGLIKQLIQIANKEKKLGKVKARRIKVSNKVEIFYGQPEHVRGKRLPRGIYKRIDLGNGRGQLVPLIVFPMATAHYSARFDFEQAAEVVVRKEFDAIFSAELANAIRTAR